MAVRIQKPEGCQAAVIHSHEICVAGGRLFEPQINRTNEQIICADRNVKLSQEYKAGLGGQYNLGEAQKILNQQVTETLGAMCLGCPHNLNRASTPEAVPSPSV